VVRGVLPNVSSRYSKTFSQKLEGVDELAKAVGKRGGAELVSAHTEAVVIQALQEILKHLVGDARVQVMQKVTNLVTQYVNTATVVGGGVGAGVVGIKKWVVLVIFLALRYRRPLFSLCGRGSTFAGSYQSHSF
jgi:hypothetical protein